MSNRYELQVTRGAVRIIRSWEAETGRAPQRGGGGTNVGQPALAKRGPITTFSSRARARMRWEFSALPWEQLGERPVLITLTYPAKWREWCPDGKAVARHRKLLCDRWEREFGGRMLGVWVMEFQPRARRPVDERQAPHIHMYVGLPERVSVEEYRGYQRRLVKRRQNERQFGKFEARKRGRAPKGEFAEWLRSAWWEIVGSGDPKHHGRGVDIAPSFWTDGVSEQASRSRMADYFWRESGKWGQKSPPENFGSLKFWGRFGANRGFEPVVGVRELDQRAALELRRVLRKYIEGQVKRAAVARGTSYRYKGPRGLDGLSAYFDDGLAVGARLYEWALAHAASKAHLPVPGGATGRLRRPAPDGLGDGWEQPAEYWVQLQDGEWVQAASGGPWQSAAS